MSKITHVTATFSASGITYRFYRGVGKTLPKGRYAKDLSSASRDRINRLLGGYLAKEIGHSMRPDHVHIVYKVSTPSQFQRARQTLSGHLLIEIDDETRRSWVEDHGADSDEWDYRDIEEFMHSLFEGTDLEYSSDLAHSGIAMFGGPGVIDRGTDWAKSRLWYWNDYALQSELEELIEKGYVLFNYAEEDKDE